MFQKAVKCSSLKERCPFLLMPRVLFPGAHSLLQTVQPLMGKTPQGPQLDVFLCLSTGSSFCNGKNPFVSMSLKVLKFCKEGSYKALYNHHLNSLNAKQKNSDLPKERQPHYFHCLRLQITFHLIYMGPVSSYRVTGWQSQMMYI